MLNVRCHSGSFTIAIAALVADHNSLVAPRFPEATDVLATAGDLFQTLKCREQVQFIKCIH